MRNPAIEMFRCLLMYGIVLLHCLGTLKWHCWAEGLLMPCVCGFVLITGWFGVKFKPSKVLRLYGVQLYCCGVCILGLWLAGRDAAGLLVAKTFMSKWWFIHAYVAMMFLAPLINMAVDAMSAHSDGERICVGVSAVLPLLFAVFVWGYLLNFNCCKRIFPQTAGLDMYSCLTLLGIYCVGRMLRVWRVFDFFMRYKAMTITGALVIGIVLCFNKIFAYYNSVLAVAFAAIVFWGFTRLDRAPRLFNAFAPSMFSVYILHMSGEDLYGISRMTSLAQYSGSVVVAALACFGWCVILDLPRRFLARWLSPFLRPIDVFWDAVAKRVTKFGSQLMD